MSVMDYAYMYTMICETKGSVAETFFSDVFKRLPIKWKQTSRAPSKKVPFQLANIYKALLLNHSDLSDDLSDNP